MLIVKLDKTSQEPIYRQIVGQIVQLVEDDSLKEGDVLPPTRELASMLAVSRFTVSQAYHHLWAKGYIESKPGSYTRVRGRPKLASCPAKGKTNVQVSLRARVATGAARPGADLVPVNTHSVGNRNGIIDFSRFILDERLFPMDAFRTALHRSLTRKRADLLNYAESAGYAPFRKYIADRMRTHCVSADPEEILITSGSMQGIELVTKLLTDRGQSVAVEEPTFASVLPLFQLFGATADPIPMRTDGMDLDILEQRLIAGKNRGVQMAFVYTIPSFHNPTGITTKQDHRERLLSLCEQFNVPFVEDSFQEEITYFRKAVLPIKSMDRTGLGLYIGSFSKVLFPGLRIGWIVARREWIERLTLLKRLSDISTSPFIQAALLKFCESGAYEQHLRKINRIFARRMEVALAALATNLPSSHVSFIRPSGGYLVWLKIEGIDGGEARIKAALLKHGVSAAMGGPFFTQPPAEIYLRLSISALDEDQIVEGAKRLGRVLREL